MEEQTVKKSRKIIVTVIIIFGLLFGIYKSIMNYIDTRTWETISVTEEVSADISEVFTYEQEVLQGDMINLNATTATIKDITHEGSVMLSFSPEVIDCNSGESIRTAIVKNGEGSLIIKKESENGDRATATLWVITLRQSVDWNN